MANVQITPNMSLPSPVPTVDPAPDWANNNFNCMRLIDAHNHTAGFGVLVPSGGLNINADLPFQNNNAISLRSIRFTPQLTAITSAAPDQGCIYVTTAAGATELYYNDYAGNQVQITKNGGVNATSSGIANGTATASFVSSVLVVLADVGVSASIDAAAYILRYAGSYPTPSGNYIALAAPAGVGGYQLTFPATTPAANGAFLTEATTGALSYTNVDNSTLNISGGILQVATHGITPTQIASASITSVQVAADTLTGGSGGNIATATIDGSNIVNNIDLPISGSGNTPTVNNSPIVIGSGGSANPFLVIAGIVTSSGTVESGIGFSPSQSGTGAYSVSFFSTPFSSLPAIVVTAATTAAVGYVTNITTNGFSVQFVNTPAGGDVNTVFSFIAAGPLV